MKSVALLASFALSICCLAPVLAQTPAAAPTPASASEAASSPESDLDALMTPLVAKLKAGKRSSADLAPDIAAFDALLAKYKDQKSEAVAKIAFMKALLYMQVLKDTAKGKALLAQIKTDFPGTQAAAQADEAATPQPEVLAAGTPAPDFKAIAVAGGADSLTLAQYKGKVVILDFWATWCGPCQRSMPHLEKVYQSVKGQDVVVLGICVSDTKENYDKWLPEHKTDYSFTFALDPAERNPEKSISAKLYGVSGIPTTYIIDKDGKVAASVVGFGGDTDKRIEEALGGVGVKVSTL